MINSADRIGSRVEAGLGHITLQAGPLNVLGIDDLRALTRALRDLDECTAILIEAKDARVFSAGVEIKDHAPERAVAMLDAYSKMALAFAEASPVIVCEIDGPALGGGFELMLLADLAICSTRAAFALPEIELAALPPVACAVLPHLIGERRAFEVIVMGKRLDAETALAWGLVSEVVNPEELSARTRAICDRLLSYSDDALTLCKRATHAGSLRGAMEVYVHDLLPTVDAAEGISAFIEKRRPTWAHTRRTEVLA